MNMRAGAIMDFASGKGLPKAAPYSSSSLVEKLLAPSLCNRATLLVVTSELTTKH